MTKQERSTPKDCVVLGAGFSKAISAEMPVLRELGPMVVERLGLGSETLDAFGGDFERWLSYLATDQPWLSTTDNLANRVLFLRASDAVGICISEAESAAVAVPPQEWLLRLVMDWCRREVAIITFNYDLLVERLLMDVLMAVSTLGDVYGMALTERMPPGSSRFVSSNVPNGPVPTVYKLHGSTNWAYGGVDAPPSDMVTLLPGSTRWGIEEHLSDRRLEQRRRFVHSGLDPLIIPPAGTKSDFYRNRALRAQWAVAAELLAATPHLSVIGFSFPATDLQVRQLVSTTIRQPDIDVVDRRESAGDDVREAIGTGCVITTYSGDAALADFATDTSANLIRWRVRPPTEAGQPFEATVSVNDEPHWTAAVVGDEAAAQTRLEDFLDLTWPGIRQRALLDRAARDDNSGRVGYFASAW